MYDRIHEILVRTSGNSDEHMDIYRMQAFQNCLPFVRSPSKSAGEAGRATRAGAGEVVGVVSSSRWLMRVKIFERRLAVCALSSCSRATSSSRSSIFFNRSSIEPEDEELCREGVSEVCYRHRSRVGTFSNIRATLRGCLPNQHTGRGYPKVYTISPTMIQCSSDKTYLAEDIPKRKGPKDPGSSVSMYK